MITIKHVLKDGTEVPDVAGHVIEGHEVLYRMIQQINERKDEDEKSNQTDVRIDDGSGIPAGSMHSGRI